MKEKDDIFRFEDFLGVDKIEDLKRMKSNLLNEGLFNDDEELEDEEEVDPKFNPYKTSFENDEDVIEDFDLDEDDILKRMKGYGWGDLTGEQMEEFENSEEYSGTKYSDEYAEEFNNYLKGIAFNSYSENDDDFGFESPFCKPCDGKGCEECDGSGMKRNSIFPDSEKDDDDNYKDRSMYSPYYSDGDHDKTRRFEESNSESEDYYKLFKDKAEDFICDIAIEGVNQNDTEVRLIVESDDWTLMFAGEIKNGKCIIPIKKLNILNEGQTGNIKLEVNADGNLFTPWEDKYIVKVSKKVTVSLNENKSNTKSKKPVKKGLGVKVNVKR